jgi:hypothetical protein
MKYLVYVLIVLFASPAFASDSSSAFSGASGISEEPAVVQESPVAEQEAEFKIDERLYHESIGSNGYYGGGFYGEEKYAAQIEFYAITSHRHDFGFGTGFVVVKDQLVPINFGSPFFAPFPIFSSGILSGGVGVGVGGFSFFSGGIGFRIR